MKEASLGREGGGGGRKLVRIVIFGVLPQNIMPKSLTLQIIEQWSASGCHRIYRILQYLNNGTQSSEPRKEARESC